MIKLNIHEAKTHLSRHLAKLEEGEVILLCRRNEPIAEIRGIVRQRDDRPVGLAKGEFGIPDSFFAPLPDEIVESFMGGGPSGGAAASRGVAAVDGEDVRGGGAMGDGEAVGDEDDRGRGG